MDAMRRTYDIGIKPVNSEEYWEPCDLIRPIAPKIFKPPGRPRKTRTEAGRPPPPPQPNNAEKEHNTEQPQVPPPQELTLEERRVNIVL
ncbi:hypothetical protein PIB30_101689 [Stylosanthes scabra]|uniref:Uncharacterized protein n=1 Tax=Stylosanthes scabra TaxID=79078 RepID=A0ABU6WVR3_9FABA|nr:hypothetical protein [Stylosanthes scabra]